MRVSVGSVTATVYPQQVRQVRLALLLADVGAHFVIVGSTARHLHDSVARLPRDLDLVVARSHVPVFASLLNGVADISRPLRSAGLSLQRVLTSWTPVDVFLKDALQPGTPSRSAARTCRCSMSDRTGNSQPDHVFGLMSPPSWMGAARTSRAGTAILALPEGRLPTLTAPLGVGVRAPSQRVGACRADTGRVMVSTSESGCRWGRLSSHHVRCRGLQRTLGRA